jgi:hypothetical protein
MDGLSNATDALSNDIGKLEIGFGALVTWRAAADPNILALQEFEVIF